jgi:hypothetical protein
MESGISQLKLVFPEHVTLWNAATIQRYPERVYRPPIPSIAHSFGVTVSLSDVKAQNLLFLPKPPHWGSPFVLDDPVTLS